MVPTRFWLSLAMASIALMMALSGTAKAQGAGSSYQTSNVIDFETGSPAGGAGTLVRTNNSLRARIATSGLDADAAYSVWWVIWNTPGNCSTPCGEDDLGIAGNSVLYAAGFVTGADGTANLTAELEAGLLPSGIDVLIPGGLRPGRGLAAEVHMVIRSHGGIIPGSVAAQVGSFAGACDVNQCEDQQAVVFPPVP